MTTPRIINREDLSTVTGGTARAKLDERIIDKLQSLTSAVADVAAQKQNQPNPASAMMPLIAMKAMKARQV